LGTDKRNPLFTVYAWEEDEDNEQLYVYYGLKLLQVVPADRNTPSFRPQSFILAIQLISSRKYRLFWFYRVR